MSAGVSAFCSIKTFGGDVVTTTWQAAKGTAQGTYNAYITISNSTVACTNPLDPTCQSQWRENVSAARTTVLEAQYFWAHPGTSITIILHGFTDPIVIPIECGDPGTAFANFVLLASAFADPAELASYLRFVADAARVETRVLSDVHAPHEDAPVRDAPCGCFPGDTKVLTPDGGKAIASLHVGDKVLAEDPKTGKVEPETVQAVIDDGIKPLMQVMLSDGSSLKVTTNHPFYIDAGGRRASADWIEAGQLLLGDRMRTAKGHDVTVVGLRYNVGYAHVYTLTVAADHDFFVGVAGVLAHNCPQPVFERPGSRHYLLRINRKSFIDTENTVIDPSVDVSSDITAINAGKATRVGNVFEINGRTYATKGSSNTLYPVSGIGFYQLSRGAYKALRLYIAKGEDAAIAEILPDPSITDPDNAMAEMLYEIYLREK